MPYILIELVAPHRRNQQRRRPVAVQRIADDISSEDFILTQPVSESRKQEFFDHYLAERQLTRTTEMAFGQAGVLRQLPKHVAPPSVRDSGFRIIVFKASFVDGVHSVLVSGQRFAMTMEEHLLTQLNGALQNATTDRLGDDISPDLSAFSSALDQMADDTLRRGGDVSLFVLAGQIGQELYDQFKATLQNPYQWYRERGITKRAVHRFMGAHAGVPVLNIADSPTPTLYAVDLAQFGTLTRYGKGPDFLPEFHVYGFTAAEARTVLARRPRLIMDPPPESGDDDERIRQLRLRVGLELWETYDLKVHDDPRAVIGRPIVDAYDG